MNERLLFRDDEPTLMLEARSAAWSFDADGHLFRLVSEARRIRLAYLFDPMLAVHLSVLDPLPHQIQAVYEEMRLFALAAGTFRTRAGGVVRLPSAGAQHGWITALSLINWLSIRWMEAGEAGDG